MSGAARELLKLDSSPSFTRLSYYRAQVARYLAEKLTRLFKFIYFLIIFFYL